MNSLRLWIALAVGVSLLAGFAGGLLVARATQPSPAPGGAFAEYRVMLVREFQLSPERERGLAGILDRYQRELDDLGGRQAHLFEAEYVRLGLKYRDLVRDYVLPESQRERFDALVSAPHIRVADGMSFPR